MKRAWLLVALLAPLSYTAAQDATQDATQAKRLPEELAVNPSVVMQETDELQTSVRFDRYDFHGRIDERKATVAAEFEYGLTDRWELDCEVPYRFRDFGHGTSFNGIGDLETAVRYGVIPVGPNPVALTAGLGITIPTGDRTRDLGEGRLALEPSITASTWLGPINVQLNGGWTRAVTSAGDEPLDEYEYNVAVIYPIERWFVGLEGNGVSTHESTVYYVTPEVIWKPMKRLELLVGVPIGVAHHDSADYGIVASVTYEWGNITHRGTDKD